MRERFDTLTSDKIIELIKDELNQFNKYIDTNIAK